jgi:hypothetical protein
MMRYLQTAKKSLEALRNNPARLSAAAKPEAATLSGDRPVAAMTLNDFASAGLIVRVRSEILDADVLFVSDNVPGSILNGPEVIYRAEELKKLARVPPDPQSLRNLQMVKEIIGGTIKNVREKGNRAEAMPSTSRCVGDSANG